MVVSAFGGVRIEVGPLYDRIVVERNPGAPKGFIQPRFFDGAG